MKVDVIAIDDEMTAAHVPVLASELIAATAAQAGETVVDMTFGAGGHSRLLAERIGPSGTLVAIDRDPACSEHFAALAADERIAAKLRFLPAAFADGLALLLAEGLRADVVIADLGLSSMQIDSGERGFSYSNDGPLDMRMDQAQELDARALVMTAEESELARIFHTYGDERFARPIARAIVRARSTRQIATTAELAAIIAAAVPARARFAAGNPAKRSFQALRIAVNDELLQVQRALPQAWQLLRTGGRLGVIAFHSGEDRRVKRFLAERAQGCRCPPGLPVCVCGHSPEAEIKPRKAIVPSAEEIAANPRSSSARLRVAIKLMEALR